MNDIAIEVRQLRKSYGSVQALRGIGFEVKRGEIFGLLGPNGAGKTTTLEIIEGLRSADAGTVRVLGLDVQKDAEKIKEKIGSQLQATGMFMHLSVREQIELFASFYAEPAETDYVLSLVDLHESAKVRTDRLSGGQRQRLALALALVNNPELVFLDEPTTGLDPQVRIQLWDVIQGLRDHGKTVLLTTHYMEEASRLCDRVCIVDEGEVIAEGAPAALIAAHFNDPAQTIAEVTMLAEQRGLALQGFKLIGPTLEDVFLKLTRRRSRETATVEHKGAVAEFVRSR